MADNGVSHALCISTTVAGFPKVQSIAAAHANLWCSAGVHPDTEGEEEASEAPAPINDAPIGPDVLRVSLPVDAALRFAEQALQLAAAGRQPCPNCGAPLDPNGHTCARKAAFLN